MNTSATNGQLPLEPDSSTAPPATPLVTRGPTPGKGVRIPKATLAAARAVHRHHVQRIEDRRQMNLEPSSAS